MQLYSETTYDWATVVIEPMTTACHSTHTHTHAQYNTYTHTHAHAHTHTSDEDISRCTKLHPDPVPFHPGYSVHLEAVVLLGQATSAEVKCGLSSELGARGEALPQEEEEGEGMSPPNDEATTNVLVRLVGPTIEIGVQVYTNESVHDGEALLVVFAPNHEEVHQ